MTDERVAGVMIVDLMDGRTIAVPLAWYPRLLEASPEERAEWEIAGAGSGIHWPRIDEDLSVDGLLRGQTVRALMPPANIMAQSTLLQAGLLGQAMAQQGQMGNYLGNMPGQQTSNLSGLLNAYQNAAPMAPRG